MNAATYDDQGESVQYGNSGTAFDQQEVFSLEDAARALTYDQTGKYPPIRPDVASPLGSAYYDWLGVLRAAIANNEVSIAVYEGDRQKTPHLRRQDFADWCNWRGLRPTFLFPDSTAAALDRGAVSSFPYQTTELRALCAAVSEFADRMQSDAPPKKAEVTKWLRGKGVSSDRLAEALDTVIRPERHRSGGQKKTKAKI